MADSAVAGMYGVCGQPEVERACVKVVLTDQLRFVSRHELLPYMQAAGFVSSLQRTARVD